MEFIRVPSSLKPAARNYASILGCRSVLTIRQFRFLFSDNQSVFERMKSLRPRHGAPFRIAAILLLAGGGFVQATAQTRYSVNVVGYSDAEFVAGSNLVANPFNAGNNTVSNLFAGLPSGSFFLPWDPLSRTFGPANEFTSQTGWADGAAMLRRPEGGFLWLPVPKRITFVGEPWPPMCVTFPAGESVSGVLPQYACGFCAGFNDCPMNPPDSTVVRKWDRQNQQFISCLFTAEYGWDPVAPTLAPDEAALFYSPILFTAKSPGFYAPTPVQLFKASRDGANVIFQFPSASEVGYSVQRSSSLGSGAWRTVLTETAVPTGGVITVTVPAGTSDAAFYRLYSLRLLNPSRAGSQFQFQFYAEEGTHYQVSRSASPSGGPWSPVFAIEGTGSLVTATDPAATSLTGYYRVEY